MNIFFQWSYGNDILNANRMVFENPSAKQNTNMFAAYTNRWTPENPTSNIPRARAQGSNEYSSLYVEDGSFLKLKNISLGYNFEAKTLKPLHMFTFLPKTLPLSAVIPEATRKFLPVILH